MAKIEYTTPELDGTMWRAVVKRYDDNGAHVPPDIVCAAYSMDALKLSIEEEARIWLEACAAKRKK